MFRNVKSIKKSLPIDQFEKIVDTYRDAIPVYTLFCETMKNILISLLDENGFKYQMAHRVKTVESLSGKLQKKYIEGRAYKTINDVEDLAGIRIIFYLESDKKKFISLLFNELTPQQLKIEERHKEKGYRSTHIIMRLGRKRLKLGEYKKFEGLKCEIQITSALFHAWSEIEHDIFYKYEKHYIGTDHKIITHLKMDLEKTMHNHIQKASDIFEFIVKKINEIEKKEL